MAAALGVKPFVVYRWVKEKIDPRGETIINVVKALQGIEPAAAIEFVRLYLGDFFLEQDQR